MLHIQAQNYPAVLPISCAEAKLLPRISPSDHSEDALLDILIASAVAYVERVTGLALCSRSYIATLDNFPQYSLSWAGFYPLFSFNGADSNSSLVPNDNLPFSIYLKPRPVTAVQKIVYVDATGTAQTLTAGTDFTVDLTSDPVRISPLTNGVWPRTALVGLANVQIYYTAGFTRTDNTLATTSANPAFSMNLLTQVPADLKVAMLLLINDAFRNREINVSGAVGRISTADDIIQAATKHDFRVDNY